MLLRRCRYSGSGSGLPVDDGRWRLPDGKSFRIHVLIPCYKVGCSLGGGTLPTAPPAKGRLASALMVAQNNLHGRLRVGRWHPGNGIGLGVSSLRRQM